MDWIFVFSDVYFLDVLKINFFTNSRSWIFGPSRISIRPQPGNKKIQLLIKNRETIGVSGAKRVIVRSWGIRRIRNVDGKSNDCHKRPITIPAMSHISRCPAHTRPNISECTLSGTAVSHYSLKAFLCLAPDNMNIFARPNWRAPVIFKQGFQPVFTSS